MPWGMGVGNGMGRHVAWATGLGERGHVCVCGTSGGGGGVVVRWGLCDLQWNMRSE